MDEAPTTTADVKPLAIHDGTEWNARWIRYCREKAIPHKVVNCYDSNILDQIKDCGGLLWMLLLDKPQDMFAGPAVLAAAKQLGLTVFPDYPEYWHYNDKLSQRYLLQSAGLPTPRAWTFLDYPSARAHVETCELPVVAKLRGGAESRNVRLLRTRAEARAYARRMFGKGFNPSPGPLADAKHRVKVAWATGGMQETIARLKRAPRTFWEAVAARWQSDRERGYLYLQEFIPGNTCDYRLVVVGEKCWGYRRLVRAGDFRASGSHIQDMDPAKIPETMVQAAFLTAARLGMRSVGIDFVMDGQCPLIVEICHCYGVEDRDYAEGFWDSHLNWHRDVIDPRHQVVDELVREVRVRP